MIRSGKTQVRLRNARGEGGRLADEIIDGTLRLIDRDGSDAEVTLRAVAKEVGISAPSIYAHFADREAIRWAVVLRTFDQLGLAIEGARAQAPASDPVAQLVAGCEAYVDFGLRFPGRYRAVFARQFPDGGPESGVVPAAGPTAGLPHPMLDDRLPPVGTEAFGLLVHGIEQCVAAGRSLSADPFGDATAIWIALHGLVSLQSTMCDFPWPERHGLIGRMVHRLAAIAGD